MFDIQWILALGALLVGFGFVIFVHELGHFLVAKWVGIKCTQFAIGFGHGICCWRKGIGFRRGSTEPEYEKLLKDGVDPASLGETEYRLNWMPLGGYVKMLGQEDMDPTARSDDPRSYNNKSVSARMAVISAGVIMNLIFGLIFFIIAFSFGVDFPPAMVGQVSEGSPAAIAQAYGKKGVEYQGLRSGDVVTHIDDEPIDGFMDIKMAAGLAEEGQRLKFTVVREGEPEPLIYFVIPKPAPNSANQDNILWIGLRNPISTEVGEPAKGDSLPVQFADAGVKPGMKVTAVGGDEVKHYHQFEQKLVEREGQSTSVTFTPEKGGSVDLELRALPTLMVHGKTRHLLGLATAVEIDRTVPKSPAAKAGLMAGDLLAKLGALEWPDYDAMVRLAQAARGKELAVTVLRDGKLVTLDKPVIPDRDGKLGVYAGAASSSNIIATSLVISPLQDRRIPRGSKLLAINDSSIDSFVDMQRKLRKIALNALADRPDAVMKADAGDVEGSNAGDTNDSKLEQEDPASREVVASISIQYEANIAGNPIETAKDVPITLADARSLGQTDWSIVHLSVFKPLEERVIAESAWDATILGVRYTHMFMVQTYLTLTRLIQGAVPVKALRGPVGIGQIGTQIAYHKSWTYLLFFLGLISINLVVINFLPIPIVDGGHMVFLIIEKLKGSPVSVRFQTAATLAGLVLIASLFLFVTYNDLLRLFVKG